MDTPMQQLILEIESCYDLVEEEHTQTKTLKWVVQQIKNRYLSQEKSAIIDTFDNGQANGDVKCQDYKDGKEYFKDTFTN